VLNRAISNHYRCAEGFLNFELTGELSEDRGYFQFGPDVTCYGRSCPGSRQNRSTSDLENFLDRAELKGRTVKTAFDPTEVVDNLRLERYVDNPSRAEELLRKLYYKVRPLTTQLLRRKVQQFHARNWRDRSLPHWPVDTTVERLCERLMLLSLRASGAERIPFVWFWPNGACGCMTMTHDVETAAGLAACEELMDMDDAAGINASFQIVPEKRYAVTSEVLDSIRRRGFEIGVQDLNHDGHLFDSREEFVRRAQIINEYGRAFGARGFRAGVLYRKPEWYDALDFAFDMSIPNVAHLDPQRGGCCTVLPYFIGDILELPVTTTQDYTLFHLLNHRAIDLWKTQTELILAKHGLVSFIVHPDYVIEPQTKAVYANLLEYLRCMRERENIWFALPSEIDCWWRARSKMSVVQDGDAFRIEGEGSERAVLGFATDVNGRLVYEFSKATGAC